MYYYVGYAKFLELAAIYSNSGVLISYTPKERKKYLHDLREHSRLSLLDRILSSASKDLGGCTGFKGYCHQTASRRNS